MAPVSKVNEERAFLPLKCFHFFLEEKDNFAFLMRKMCPQERKTSKIVIH